MKNIKKLYDELFGMEQDGKMREKVFFARITASVSVILLCMAAMCMSAYAFFTSSVTSDMNTIRAANYDLEITAPEGLQASEDGSYVLEGSMTETDEGEQSGEGEIGTESTEAKEFQFTLKPSDDSTASVGYCKIEVEYDGETKYCYTQPIWRLTEGGTSEIEKVTERAITIAVPDGKSVTVKFIPEWGSCAQTTIDNNTIDLTDWNDETVFFAPTDEDEGGAL